MKTHHLFFLSLFVITACQKPKENTSQLQFTIDAFDVAQDQMEVTFEVTNPSEDVWQGGEWTLHWNQFSGVLQQESLPEGIHIVPTKNSQYWQLHFGSSYSLNPGETLKFSALQTGIMPRLVMGPIGFFVHNASQDKLYDLESKIHWEKARGVSDLNLPTAADRYATYEGITPLPKEDLHWVLPTPQKIELQNDYRPFPTTLSIDFGAFQEQAAFLSERMQQGLDFSLTPNSDKAQIQIQKDSTLEEEAYQLVIGQENITIAASGYSGLFYGMGSLHQILIHAQREGDGIPLLQIEDAPRFGHRGFMLDLSRNYAPKEKILEILDYMAYYKLNLFDLKLSDDEGWRIEIPGLEELTEIGSKRGFTQDEKDRLLPMYGSGSGEKESQGSGYLTRTDFIEILQAATQRNIRVVPQLSFPSHARAAVVAMKARYENLLEKGEVEAANEYRLHDPNDLSDYTSAQLFKDNTICICDPSAFRFFEKVFDEIKAMYTEADLPMKTYNIGADELPYGVWQKSPLCEDYIKKSNEITTYQDLYDASVKRLNKIVTASGVQMAGWEDVLLSHSEKSQSEIEVNKNLMDLDFIPSVWNNTWGGGREDMIYKLANMGFKSVMSNSSAFYFDMTDDMDMENPGLSWSGYVNYKDGWGTEPLDVFANKVKIKNLGIDTKDLKNKVKLQEKAKSNFLGIQSQLWTETAANAYEFDRMLMPNLIVFSERAWSSKEPWLENTSAELQEPELTTRWNTFVNTVGKRHLPYLSSVYNELLYDLPKPGAVVEEGILRIRQQFPGLEIRFTRDGTTPTRLDEKYTTALEISPSDQIRVRTFDPNGRGGNPIQVN